MAFAKTTTKRHATQHEGGGLHEPCPKRAGPCHTESAPALIYPGIGYDEELTSVLKHWKSKMKQDSQIQV